MLLPLRDFEKIFEPFKDKKVCLIVPSGNVGDKLILEGCLNLMKKFCIKYDLIPSDGQFFLKSQDLLNRVLKTCFDDYDDIIIGGGGNMGSRYSWQKNLLKMKLYLLQQTKKPITIFPQSYTNSYDYDGYAKIWVRETESQNWCKNSQLGPDLALGYDLNRKLKNPTKKNGVWLRKDEEMLRERNLVSEGDPVLKCKTVDQYFDLVEDYEEIVTDRLHFAIAGLIASKKVTLIANGYYKNKAVYECWLKKLGCLWSDI